MLSSNAKEGRKQVGPLLLGTQAGGRVRYFYAKNLCSAKRTVSRGYPHERQGISPLKDGCPVSARYIVCNLCGEALVVHQKKVEFPNVADKELLEAIREKMACLLNRLSYSSPQIAGQC